jgi:hypothetical protein
LLRLYNKKNRDTSIENPKGPTKVSKTWQLHKAMLCKTTMIEDSAQLWNQRNDQDEIEGDEDTFCWAWSHDMRKSK